MEESHLQRSYSYYKMALRSRRNRDATDDSRENTGLRSYPTLATGPTAVIPLEL